MAQAIDNEMAHVIAYSMQENGKDQGNTHTYLSPEIHEMARQRVVRLLNSKWPSVMDSYPNIPTNGNNTQTDG